VKTQIWIAISIYVPVAIVRKRFGLERSLYQILQISVSPVMGWSGLTGLGKRKRLVHPCSFFHLTSTSKARLLGGTGSDELSFVVSRLSKIILSRCRPVPPT
jgi:hypothetical protein